MKECGGEIFTSCPDCQRLLCGAHIQPYKNSFLVSCCCSPSVAPPLSSRPSLSALAPFKGALLWDIGAGSGVIATSDEPVIAALTLGACVYTLGAISGTHINPAITIGILLVKKISPTDAAPTIPGMGSDEASMD